MKLNKAKVIALVMKLGSLSHLKQADDLLKTQLQARLRSILESKLHQATTTPALSAIDPG